MLRGVGLEQALFELRAQVSDEPERHEDWRTRHVSLAMVHGDLIDATATCACEREEMQISGKRPLDFEAQIKTVREPHREMIECAATPRRLVGITRLFGTGGLREPPNSFEVLSQPLVRELGHGCGPKDVQSSEVSAGV